MLSLLKWTTDERRLSNACCVFTHLDKLGLDLPVGGHLLMGQHVSVALGQGLLTGGGHLDGVGDDGLQDRPQVQAGGGLVVHPLLPTGGARAAVQRTHRRGRLRGRGRRYDRGARSGVGLRRLCSLNCKPSAGLGLHVGSTGATEAALCGVLAQTRSGKKKSKKHQEKKK